MIGTQVRVLAIETSERVGTLATLLGEGIADPNSAGPELVRAVTLPSDQRSARSLLPSIQALLADCDWQPQQLDLVCVSTGPGSFTGLRIGVTAAKTLAYATGASLVGVHTLAAIAANVTTPPQRLWTVLDAQRQELFAACFEPGWQLSNLPATRILGVDDWLAELQADDSVCGPPLGKLADRLPTGVRVCDASAWPPSAASVGRLGIAAHASGMQVAAMQLVPQYYRKSAAEEKIDS